MPFAALVAQLGPVDMTKQAQDTAGAVAKAWDPTWENVINGPGVYPAIVGLSLTFAGVCLIFFVVNWFKDSLQETITNPGESSSGQFWSSPC